LSACSCSWGGVARVFKAQLGGGIMRVLFGGLTLAGAAIIGLVGLNLQTYAQLSKEWAVGTVTIKKGATEHDWVASIDLMDDGKPRGQPVDYQVTGEEIFVGGPIITFKPWGERCGHGRGVPRRDGARRLFQRQLHQHLQSARRDHRQSGQ
jgi:hypothetical protein